MAPRTFALALVGALLGTAAGQDAVCPELEVMADPVCTSELKTPGEFILAKTQRANGYDKSLRPPCGNSTHKGPTVVEVQMFLQQVNTIDTKSGIIYLNGVLRSYWNDPRLSYDKIDEGGCFDMINLRGDASNALWMPDIYIDNLVKKSTYSTFVELVTIDPEGNIMRSEQINVALKMSVQLGPVPYDHHTGKIVVASYSQDISRLRVIPRGGKVEEGQSGVGLVAPALKSPTWTFVANGDDAETNGFETPGDMSILFDGSWDYVTMSFKFDRKPKYFLDQVVVPSIFFLLVSNIQFYVEPKVAPARAFLCVIPVLIMRLLSNTVYSSLPEGSQAMWLVDFLMCSTVLTLLGVVEFGIVQFFLQRENVQTAHLTSLKALKPTIMKIVQEARDEKVPFRTLLDKFKHTTVEADQVARVSVDSGPDSKGKDDKKGLRTLCSEEAVKRGLKEWELLIINYIQRIFQKFDADDSGKISARELRKALTYFNIYMSKEQVGGVICVLLRDEGEVTPEKELSAELTLERFCVLLSAIEKYSFMTRKTNILGRLHQLPPSKRLDAVARFAFPIIIFLSVLVFFLLVPTYDVKE